MKRMSRSGGALPEAGQGAWPGQRWDPGRSQDSRNGNQIKKISVALALSLLLWPATPAAWSGKVVGVVDGITVLHDGRGEQIRLWGIDCPEKNQDFGTKAKQITSILVFTKVVDVEPVTTDRYGRTVAFARVGDILVNEELTR